MFSRPKSFSVLYGIQRNLLNLFYLISVIALFWLIFILLHDILGAGGAVIIPVALVYLVLIVLVYSVMHVISYIPANLAGAFDPLKNGIAEGSIGTADILSRELSGFMCSFFNFAFFDIKSCMVRLSDNEPVFSEDGLLAEMSLNMDELERHAGSIVQTGFFGKASGRSGFIYIVPLIFGEKRLGYMVLLTSQKLWRIFIHLLNEFENDFIDDQVVHVLANEAEAIS